MYCETFLSKKGGTNARKTPRQVRGLQKGSEKSKMDMVEGVERDYMLKGRTGTLFGRYSEERRHHTDDTYFEPDGCRRKKGTNVIVTGVLQIGPVCLMKSGRKNLFSDSPASILGYLDVVEGEREKSRRGTRKETKRGRGGREGAKSEEGDFFLTSSDLVHERRGKRTSSKPGVNVPGGEN